MPERFRLICDTIQEIPVGTEFTWHEDGFWEGTDDEGWSVLLAPHEIEPDACFELIEEDQPNDLWRTTDDHQ